MRRMLEKHSILLLLFFTTSSISFSTLASFDFPAPKKRFKSLSSQSANQFNSVITNFKKALANEVEVSTGKQLLVKFDKEEPRAKIYTTRDFDKNPVIYITPSFLELPGLTSEVLSLFLCHELGHHLGGAPKKFRRTKGRRWDSIEGQADFYATSKCMPKLFGPKENSRAVSKYPLKLREDLEKRCGANIYCQRSAKIALDLSQLIASLKRHNEMPHLLKKDRSIVSETRQSHPSPQCRLDTFISGAHCSFKLQVPFDLHNISKGSCIDEVSKQPEALRPACWFNANKY